VKKIAIANTRVRSSRTTSGMRFIPTVTAPAGRPLRAHANLHTFSWPF
jgi:hypothetical protein